MRIYHNYIFSQLHRRNRSRMWDNWKRTLNNWKNLHERVDRLQKLGGLRIWILHVLSHGPKNGVEIMDAIEEHYNSMYKMRAQFMERAHHEKHYNMHLKKTMNRKASRPSPGSVYPMLKKMVAEELIYKMDDGRYDLTETGRETLYDIFGTNEQETGSRKPRVIERALTEMDNYLSFIEDMKKEDLVEYKDLINDLSHRMSKINDEISENPLNKD